jgi:DNA-directed RNA polymerase specialized sigma24 family protein
MDDDQAISRLPHLCREAVRRHRAGLPIAVIARQLAIEPASARSLIELAEAKILRLRSISPQADIE